MEDQVSTWVFSQTIMALLFCQNNIKLAKQLEKYISALIGSTILLKHLIHHYKFSISVHPNVPFAPSLTTAVPVLMGITLKMSNARLKIVIATVFRMNSSTQVYVRNIAI